MIPMCTVPRAAPIIPTEQTFETSSIMPFQDRQDPGERIDGRHVHARATNFQERGTPHRDLRTHERSPSPLQTVQLENDRPICNVPDHDHHQYQLQRRAHHNQDRYEPPANLASRVKNVAAAIRPIAHQCAQQCLAHHHLDKPDEWHHPADRYRTPNTCNHESSLAKDLLQPVDLTDRHHPSPLTMPITNQSPEIERRRGISLARANSERQNRGRQMSGREADADLTMSTRTTRTGDGDPDTSYGFDLGLDFNEPTKGIARLRRHEDDEGEEDVEGEKSDTGSEHGSENGTVAGRAPRSKTRNEVSNASRYLRLELLPD
jgi:hypothetical protein